MKIRLQSSMYLSGRKSVDWLWMPLATSSKACRRSLSFTGRGAPAQGCTLQSGLGTEVAQESNVIGAPATATHTDTCASKRGIMCSNWDELACSLQCLLRSMPWL